MTAPGGLPVAVHLGPDDMVSALRRDARHGLLARPKELPPKWFYDELGSSLFEAITRLPEYYPTRRERQILEAHADDVAMLSGADTVVELGSGTSEKTRRLLKALSKSGSLRRFIPFDVSEVTLRTAGARCRTTHSSPPRRWSWLRRPSAGRRPRRPSEDYPVRTTQ